MKNIFEYFWLKKKEPELDEFTVSVAESVTAGALSNSLCAEPGASKYFKGGIIAYSINSKKEILGVDIKYAEKNNFANPFTTFEMAKSVANMFNSRIGMATTGYSLPTSRDENLEKGECLLDIKVPYAFICLYDSKTGDQIINKVVFKYDNTKSDIINKATMQAKVGLEGRRIYMEFKNSKLEVKETKIGYEKNDV